MELSEKISLVTDGKPTDVVIAYVWGILICWNFCILLNIWQQIYTQY